MKNYFARVLIV